MRIWWEWTGEQSECCQTDCSEAACVVCSRAMRRSGWRRRSPRDRRLQNTTSGSPTVVQSGNHQQALRAPAACNPNEVSVVQLRRVRWAHDVSSMLSANMVSSSVKSVCCYGHQRTALTVALCQNKKGRVFTRPAGTFPDTQGVRDSSYFGGSLDFGVAGFRQRPCRSELSELSAWLRLLPEVSVQPHRTARCRASTTGLVMSTASPHQRTLLCGQGFDVSTIMPNPFSCEYFTIIGAIFCRIFEAISCCWLPNSSWASCTLRSKLFCLRLDLLLQVRRRHLRSACRPAC